MKPRSYHLDYSQLVAPRPFLCSSCLSAAPSRGFLGQWVSGSTDSGGFQPVGGTGGWAGGRMEEGYLSPAPLLGRSWARHSCSPSVCGLHPASPLTGLQTLRPPVPPQLWRSLQLLGHFSRGFTSHLPIAQRGPFPKISSPKAPISVFCQELDTFTCFILPATRPGSFMIPILRREN